MVCECIDLFLEKGLFIEFDKLVIYCCMDFGMEKQKIFGDGVVIGYGMIGKWFVYVFVQDFIVFGGVLFEMYVKKICKVMDMVMQMGVFIIGLNDLGGVCIQEGVCLLVGYVEIFLCNFLVFGVIFQISVIMGLCVGGVVYLFVLIDFILMVKNFGYMFIIGFDVVKSVIQEEVSKEDLGGVDVYIMKLGVVYFFVENDIECINYICELIFYLFGNNMEEFLFVVIIDFLMRFMFELLDLVFINFNQLYDMKEMICVVVDDNSFFELQEEFVCNIVIGYICLNGKMIGVVVNQLLVLVGMFDINVFVKVVCFVCFCDVFNILLFILVDVLGFFLGVDQEYGGIICNGVKLFYVYCEVMVLKVMVIVCKVYGGVYDVMSFKYIRGDVNLVYFIVEIVVMGFDGVVNIFFYKEIDKVVDIEVRCKELQDDYCSKFVNFYWVVELGYVDEVIDLVIICMCLICSFEMFVNKWQFNLFKKYLNFLF